MKKRCKSIALRGIDEFYHIILKEMTLIRNITLCYNIVIDIYKPSDRMIRIWEI